MACRATTDCRARQVLAGVIAGLTRACPRAVAVRHRRGPTVHPMTHDGCTLPPETASVSAARRYVESTLERWGLHEAGWSCTQLISELATNAVIHARTEFTVELSCRGSLLRVAVRDGAARSPGVRHYAADSTTGRGLRLIESMADAWGVQPDSRGKTVWFEIDTSRRASVTSWDDGADVDLDNLLRQLAVQDDGSSTTARAPGGQVPVRERRVA
jgi:anti-sigma regulatory factor (Ser/Thr protein kinase)